MFDSQEFTKMSDLQLSKVVNTNLLGCLLCTRAAWRLMREQPTGGHIFNMDGAGANGSPTPQYAAYGATKAGEPISLPILPHFIPSDDKAM